MKRFFLSLTLLAVTAFGFAAVLPATTAYADSKSQVCQGVNTVDGAGGGSGCAGGASGLNKIITNGLNIFSIIIGIVAVVMIMVGGFKYITAGGDSGNITSAKHTIIYALVGLVVVAIAQALVQFVLKKATD